jgi:hypothetical protein
MHLSLNILVHFNKFIVKKHVSLQDIILESLPKNVIPISTHFKEFSISLCHLRNPNTLKTFTINRYQHSLAPTFHFIDLKMQRKTFDHLIINLC